MELLLFLSYFYVFYSYFLLEIMAGSCQTQCEELHRTQLHLTFTPSPAQREFEHTNDDLN